jgi:hypothetical protein
MVFEKSELGRRWVRHFLRCVFLGQQKKKAVQEGKLRFQRRDGGADEIPHGR